MAPQISIIVANDFVIYGHRHNCFTGTEALKHFTKKYIPGVKKNFDNSELDPRFRGDDMVKRL